MQKAPLSQSLSRRAARQAPGFAAAKSGRQGFTLVEVSIAFTILTLCLAGILTTLTAGFKSLDTARCGTVAAQIMQSQIETLRLQNWAGISAQPKSRPFTQQEIAKLMPSDASTLAARFSVLQEIEPDPVRPTEVVNIRMTVTWDGVAREKHTRVISTRYAQNGLYAYYYSSN
jgi:prepilin-type N-terminal cleavage/methylation domain-containing protein